VSLHLPLHKFEAQLRLIRKEADLVPLMDILTREAPNERRVAITFDDAYHSALELGVGTCVSEGVHSTVFVAPALLGTVPVWDRRALAGRWGSAERSRFLWVDHGRDQATIEGQVHGAAYRDDEEQLRIATHDELQAANVRGASLVSFGNHTLTHPNLAALPTTDIVEEARRTQRWLDSHLVSSRIPVIAYPFGLAPQSDAWAEVDHDVGLEWGLLAQGGWCARPPESERFAISRWNVPAAISAAGFMIRLRGRLLRA
jgi:peptidoglycan/xylan/chitin deacetylase (PgdA/CDA1 family)